MNEQEYVRRVIYLLNGLALLPPYEAINGLSVGDLLLITGLKTYQLIALFTFPFEK
jgi:hypothetical protein